MRICAISHSIVFIAPEMRHRGCTRKSEVQCRAQPVFRNHEDIQLQPKRFLIACLLAVPACVGATTIPMLGHDKADSHQRCGDKIDVEVHTLDDHTTLLGLVNKQTHNMDLFISLDQSASQMAYSKFAPVKFDSLSGRYVPTDDKDIDIVWGSALDENKQISYSLALGPEVYTCSALQKWPDEKANQLYGEAAHS